MPELNAEERDEIVDRAFKALASRPRRQILLMLAAGDGGCCTPGEICACDFSEQLGLGAPTISHHMRKLQDAGLVTSRKEGLWVYYQLRPEVIAAIANELRALVAGCCEPGEA